MRIAPKGNPQGFHKDDHAWEEVMIARYVLDVLRVERPIVLANSDGQQVWLEEDCQIGVRVRGLDKGSNLVKDVVASTPSVDAADEATSESERVVDGCDLLGLCRRRQK